VLKLLRASVDGAHKIVQIMEYVYLLKCSDGTYYTGHTANLDERLKRHNKGENIYTKPRRPVALVTYLAFSDKYKAIAFEKYLKSGSGKAFAQKRLV
jgi:putative endonuclease